MMIDITEGDILRLGSRAVLSDKLEAEDGP